MPTPGSSSSASPQAWRWLLLNLLVLPGLGSIKGGRRRVGGWQLALGLVGFIASAGGVMKMALDWVNAMTSGIPLELDTRLIWWAAAGLVLFFISWFWALATSLELMRGPPPTEAPPKP